jgi:hypothetical protein
MTMNLTVIPQMHLDIYPGFSISFLVVGEFLEVGGGMSLSAEGESRR